MQFSPLDQSLLFLLHLNADRDRYHYWCLMGKSIVYFYNGLALACVIVLHTPDGHHHFSVIASSIHSVTPIEAAVQNHLAPGTHSIVMIDGKHRGVHETEEQIIHLRRIKCGLGTTVEGK